MMYDKRIQVNVPMSLVYDLASEDDSDHDGRTDPLVPTPPLVLKLHTPEEECGK